MDNSVKDAIAVITATRNRSTLLHKTIESVRRQDYTGQIVHYVINDAGEDALNILSDIVYIKRQQRGGPGAARNTGLVEALKNSFAYICFLDDDDIWYSDFIRFMVSNIRREDDLIYGSLVAWTFDKTGDCASIRQSEPWTPGKLRDGNYIPLPTAFFKRTFFEKTGLFREDIGRAVDWILFVQGEKAGCKFRQVSKIVGERTLRVENSDNITMTAPEKCFPSTTWERLREIVKEIGL